jgi:ABC-type nitrate/sulfonate/bicarbonate transport system permease component
VVGFLLLWLVLGATGVLDPNAIPGLPVTVEALAGELVSADFWAALGATLSGWGLGLLLGAVAGLLLGTLIGLSSVLQTSTAVVVEFCKTVPIIAILPLAILVLGTSLIMKVTLVAFGVTWPLLVQTMYGVRDVDPVAVDTARAFHIPRLSRLYRITLPGAVPYIATGIRIASTVALILAFTAELFMGLPGLGAQVNYAQSYGLHEELYAYALATGFLGLAIHLLSTGFERRALRWHPSQRLGKV